MKKLMTAFFALLLLPSLAFAQGEMVSITELREQVQQMGRWTQSYTDELGRKVDVDIAPIVPEVHAFPIHVAKNEILPIENVWSVYDPAMIDAEEKEDGIKLSYVNPDTNEEAVVYISSIGGNLLFIKYENLNTRIEGDPKKLESYTGALYCSSEVDRSFPYLDGYDLTVQDCIDRANDQLGAFFPDDALDLDIVWVEVIANTRALYACTLRQNIEGIPILMGAGDPVFGLDEKEIRFKKPQSWNHRGELYWGSFIKPYYDFFAFVDGGYQIQFRPLKKVGTPVNDVPLCSMEKVIESIQTQIEHGHIRSVYAMRLGYCCYLDENESIVLYPVWEVECDYFYPPEKEARNYIDTENIAVTDGLDYHTMIFNAQTGEFMDPMELREELLNCPDIILWENVR